MADFNREACQKRNRRAALLHGLNSTPVRFFRSEEVPEYSEHNLAASWGKLPKTEAAVMAAINARCRPGTTLAPEDVWWGYMEAANDSFIRDRFMFLDASTLKNIAKDAEAGYAYMNSHRTGGLSQQTELPFGWTYGGRYEEADGKKRAIVGVYMRLTNDKGEDIRPNGASGPSSRDLAAMVDAGTLPDTSVGLHGGKIICDPCAEEMEFGEWGEPLCGHYPGTTYGLTDSQQKAQKARGVPEGCSSYTLAHARCGETSSVYDGAVDGAGFKFAPIFNGAVPGTGFRTALSLCRRGVDADTAAQIRRAYGSLLRDHDFSRGEQRPPAGQTFSDHSESVLAAVEEWAERLEGLIDLREGEGRSLSADRWALTQRVYDRLGKALARKGRTPAQRLRALRLSQIAQQAGLSVPAGR